MKNEGYIVTQMRQMISYVADQIGGDEGEKFNSTFGQRMVKAGAGLDNRNDIFRDMLTEVAKADVERVAGPLRVRVRQLEAAVMGDQLEARKGQTPATPAGSPGGGMTYDQLMDLPPDEYGKIPEADRRRLFAESAKSGAATVIE